MGPTRTAGNEVGNWEFRRVRMRCKAIEGRNRTAITDSVSDAKCLNIT